MNIRLFSNDMFFHQLSAVNGSKYSSPRCLGAVAMESMEYNQKHKSKHVQKSFDESIRSNKQHHSMPRLTQISFSGTWFSALVIKRNAAMLLQNCVWFILLTLCLIVTLTHMNKTLVFTLDCFVCAADPTQSPSLRGEPSSWAALELKPCRGPRPWRWPPLPPLSPEPRSYSVRLSPETPSSSTTFREGRCSSKVRATKF